ncbi:hypothetical protein [Delftia phage PhiW-14]|uniref:Uncharacterized protein n=1 Tax=Delftia phage PhiW-14 TaxID=665032 RepID=C9DGA2_BPW14|nr:hypothetical protein DP-phiW-14_gp132 [Delftia phage PhiW-14]ACV50153.1 hypothetical protein [Delftia phage PhiW-14]
MKEDVINIKLEARIRKVLILYEELMDMAREGSIAPGAIKVKSMRAGSFLMEMVGSSREQDKMWSDLIEIWCLQNSRRKEWDGDHPFNASRQEAIAEHQGGTLHLNKLYESFIDWAIRYLHAP